MGSEGSTAVRQRDTMKIIILLSVLATTAMSGPTVYKIDQEEGTAERVMTAVSSTEAVFSSSSAAERVEPVASRRFAWAPSRASARKAAAVVREDSDSLRLATSAVVQVGSAEATMYPPTVLTSGLAG